MKRAVIAIAILLIGIAIGSCIAVSRGGTRPAVAVVAPQDWRPVVGVRYERPGSHARTVTEVWPGGVAYRWDRGRERYCTAATWKRWATKGGM